MKRHILSALLALAPVAVSSVVHAQNIDAAFDAYEKKDYEQAASAFYAVRRLSDDQGEVAEAQYGLARSYEKLGLHVAALSVWSSIAEAGNSHPRFGAAIEGLVNSGEELSDDLTMPKIIDKVYNGPNVDTISKLNPEILQRVYFHLGRFVFNRQNFKEAGKFFTAVKEGNPAYPHAQYMQGLLRLGVGQAGRAAKHDIAATHFENARASIPADTKDASLVELRDLVSLALARLYYEQAFTLDEGPGRKQLLNKAKLEFQKVPRFSNMWAEALFERAWANTLDEEYGRALGALHSLHAPYFQDEFFPEAKILQAIIYWYNCQWDRVHSILTETRTTYGPMAERMQSLSESNLDFDEWYPLLQKSLEPSADPEDKSLIPRPVALAITKDPAFAKMEKFLKELEREQKLVNKSKVFGKSDMGQGLTEEFDQLSGGYLGLMGKFLKIKVRGIADELSGISTRAGIIDLETNTAEADWLEQGREIENLQRKRLPRPFIPDDTFQFWWFRNEYWIDELGYYEFTVKTECYE